MTNTYDSSYDRRAWQRALNLRKPRQTSAGTDESAVYRPSSSEPQTVSLQKSAQPQAPLGDLSTTDATANPTPAAEVVDAVSHQDEDAPLAKEATDELPPLPELHFNDRDVYREEVWQALLAWGSEALTANWAYVSDARGLIIASHGQISGLDEERVTSNVFSAMVDLDRCTTTEDSPKFLTFFLNGYWHVVLCQALTRDMESWLLVGFTSRLMPRPRLLARMYSALSERLAEM